MINYACYNEKIETILDHYLYDLNRKIQMGDLRDSELAPNLGIMSALLKAGVKDKDCEKIILSILGKIKSTIEKGNVIGVGAFGGITEFAIAVSNFYEQNGFCKGLKKQIDLIVLAQTKIHLNYCIEHDKELRMTFYDLTVGISGTGIYILKFMELTEATVKIIEYIIEYLVEQYRKNQLCVKAENEKEKRLFPEGNINMGVAHGVVGVALFLSYAYKKNIIVQGQEEVIKAVLNTYKEFEILRNEGIITWPSQMSIKDCINRQKNDIMNRKRMSWCYGASGISRCLYLIATWTKDNFFCERYYQNLLNISRMKLDEYHLDSAIVCHGYSGLMVILDAMNLDRHSKIMETKVDILLNEILALFDETKEYGYVNFVKEDKGGRIVIKTSEQYDILLGASGVMLSLLAVIYNDSYIKNQLFIT